MSNSVISTMSIGQELMHQNNVFQTTTGQVLAKPKIGESDGHDVFLAVGLTSKLVPEVLLFVQIQERRMTLYASLARPTFKR